MEKTVESEGILSSRGLTTGSSDERSAVNTLLKNEKLKKEMSRLRAPGYRDQVAV